MITFKVTDGSNTTEFHALTVAEGIETLKEFHTLPYYQQERMTDAEIDTAMASGWYIAMEPSPVKPPLEPTKKKASKKKVEE